MPGHYGGGMKPKGKTMKKGGKKGTPKKIIAKKKVRSTGKRTQEKIWFCNTRHQHIYVLEKRIIDSYQYPACYIH